MLGARDIVARSIATRPHEWRVLRGEEAAGGELMRLDEPQIETNLNNARRQSSCTSSRSAAFNFAPHPRKRQGGSSSAAAERRGESGRQEEKSRRTRNAPTQTKPTPNKFSRNSALT